MRTRDEIEAALKTVLADAAILAGEPLDEDERVIIGASISVLSWVLGSPIGSEFESLLIQARADHAERDRRLKL